MNSLEINRSIIALSQIKGLGRKKIGRILEEISDFNHASFMELIEIGIRLNLLSKMSPIGEFLNARIAANNIVTETSSRYWNSGSQREWECLCPLGRKAAGRKGLCRYQWVSLRLRPCRPSRLFRCWGNNRRFPALQYS